MEPASGAALFARADELSQRYGWGALTQTTVGGASDGNFTAGIGVPTLDGLGAVGGGAHADDEHVLVDLLVPRTQLLMALLTDVLDGGRPPDLLR
jgi:glutamate carboxypeptidase